MYLGEVIGTVVATRKDESLIGTTLLVVQPLDERGKTCGAPLVAADTVSAGRGERVFLVGGREASQALPKAYGPIDAAIVGIVDHVEVGQPGCS